MTSGAIVTVVGPGGIGKSRLAAAFADEAARLRRRSVGGRLRRHGDASQMVTGLTTALGTAADADAFENVIRELAGRGPALVVFDGVDHVADETANVIASLNRRCPTVAILVTNRVALGLDIETVVRPGTSTPRGPEGHASSRYASAPAQRCLTTMPPDRRSSRSAAPSGVTRWGSNSRHAKPRGLVGRSG